jgi:hypothetical protein
VSSSPKDVLHIIERIGAAGADSLDHRGDEPQGPRRDGGSINIKGNTKIRAGAGEEGMAISQTASAL